MVHLLTPEILRAALPSITATNAQIVCANIGPALTRYSINSPRRIAAFVAQLAHESAMFTVTSENLNYSAAGLTKTWPKRFPAALAPKYAHNPRAIASRAYADRYGNGPEATGDGWKFRARGFLQLTFKDNYQAFATAMGMTLADATTYLETPEGAFMSGSWFWNRANLNSLADGWQITNISKRINGGTNGLAERIKFSNALLKALTEQ